MTPTTALSLSIRLFMFELRETGDWDIFLGPPERARTETGGADQWVLERRECSGFARVNKVTSASLGYPLSVSNKTLLSKCHNFNLLNFVRNRGVRRQSALTRSCRTPTGSGQSHAGNRGPYTALHYKDNTLPYTIRQDETADGHPALEPRKDKRRARAALRKQKHTGHTNQSE